MTTAHLNSVNKVNCEKKKQKRDFQTFRRVEKMMKIPCSLHVPTRSRFEQMQLHGGKNQFGSSTRVTAAVKKDGEAFFLAEMQRIIACSEKSVHPHIDIYLKQLMYQKLHPNVLELRFACTSFAGATFLKRNRNFCNKYFVNLRNEARIPLNYASEVRMQKDLKERIGVHTHLLGNYKIYDGCQAKWRQDISKEDWERVCYQRDLFFGSNDQTYQEFEVVLDDLDENVDVFRGQGRCVYDLPGNEVYAETLTHLFMAFPNCFTWTYFSKEERARQTFQATFYDVRAQMMRPYFIVTLTEPLHVRRLNLIYRPGLYRLERTIFLTLKHSHVRTQAICSAYCHENGTPVYWDTVYKQPVWAHLAANAREDQISKEQPAGTARMYLAAKIDANDEPELLGFWVGSYSCRAYMFTINNIYVDCNQHLNQVEGARVARTVGARYRLRFDENVSLPNIDGTVTSAYLEPVCNDATIDDKHRACIFDADDVHSGVTVEYLCAASPKNLTRDSPRAVAFYLFMYAIVDMYFTNIKSLTLWARRWASRTTFCAKTKGNLRAGQMDHHYTSASVAHFYNKQFGMELLPHQFIGPGAWPLDSRDRVQSSLLVATGLMYIWQRWSTLLQVCHLKYRPDEMVMILPELHNFYNAMMDARNRSGYVDFDALFNLPLYVDSNNFCWKHDDVDEQSEDCSWRENHIVGNGYMFRYYPTLEEMGERIDQEFDIQHKRLQNLQQSNGELLQSQSVYFSQEDRNRENGEAQQPDENDDARRTKLMENNMSYMRGETEELEYHPDGTTTEDLIWLFKRRESSSVATPYIFQLPVSVDNIDPALMYQSPPPINLKDTILGHVHYIIRQGRTPIAMPAPAMTKLTSNNMSKPKIVALIPKTPRKKHYKRRGNGSNRSRSQKTIDHDDSEDDQDYVAD